MSLKTCNSISEVRSLLERAGLKVEGFFKDSEGSDGGVTNADLSDFRVLAVCFESYLRNCF